MLYAYYYIHITYNIHCNKMGTYICGILYDFIIHCVCTKLQSGRW